MLWEKCSRPGDSVIPRTTISSDFRRYWLVLLLLASSFLTGASSGAPAQPRVRPGRDVSQFVKRRDERRAKFIASLEELATECDAKGLAAPAGQIRELAEPVDSAELHLASLPRTVQAAIPHDLPADERYWRTQLRSKRQDFARDLLLLSRQALNNGHVGLSFDLVHEVALHDPDNAGARHVLGFVRSGDQWVTAFESRMIKEKNVWHEQFGWLPKEHVERYERGERYYKPLNRWISAAKEAEIRRDFANAWVVRTEHYLVRTNHSLERGVELAKKLEDFHGLFFQLMAGFFNSPDKVQQLLKPLSAQPQPPPQHKVHYYASRDEYLAALRNETDQPVERTRGMYFPRSGIAFFFFDRSNDGDDSTLYHEATHQLLSRSRPNIGDIGVRANFWIIEGIACYMESFRREREGFSVGDPHHNRLLAARVHFVDEGYYVPLRDFARLGMYAYQHERKLAMNYSQGAALVHFFMHYDNGRYREALIEHISQVYSPNRAIRDFPDSLEELTGVSYEELDQQYARHLQQLDPLAIREVGARPAAE